MIERTNAEVLGSLLKERVVGLGGGLLGVRRRSRLGLSRNGSLRLRGWMLAHAQRLVGWVDARRIRASDAEHNSQSNTSNDYTNQHPLALESVRQEREIAVETERRPAGSIRGLDGCQRQPIPLNSIAIE